MQKKSTPLNFYIIRIFLYCSYYRRTSIFLVELEPWEKFLISYHECCTIFDGRCYNHAVGWITMKQLKLTSSDSCCASLRNFEQASLQQIRSPHIKFCFHDQSLFFDQYGNFPKTDSRHAKLTGCQGFVDYLEHGFAQLLTSFIQPDKNMGIKKQHYSTSQEMSNRTIRSLRK